MTATWTDGRLTTVDDERPDEKMSWPKVTELFEQLDSSERSACLVLSAKNETKPQRVRPIYSADLVTRQGLRKLNDHVKLLCARSPDTAATYNGHEMHL
eukprot:4153584-Amphidinium_carterae.1